jgi:hypothetical protein
MGPLLEENRIERGQAWAVPLILGAQSYRHDGDALKALGFALGGYMAPLPAAAIWVLWRMARKRGYGY